MSTTQIQIEASCRQHRSKERLHVYDTDPKQGFMSSQMFSQKVNFKMSTTSYEAKQSIHSTNEYL